MYLFDYFICKQKICGLKGFSLASYYANAKLLIDLSLFISLVTFSLFIYRYFFLNIETISLLVLLIVPLCLVSGLFYLRKTGRTNFQSWIILICTIVALPFRTYYTGGVDAPNITWYATGLVIVGATHRKEILYACSLIFFIQLTALHFFLTPPEYITPIGARLLVHLSGLAVILHTMRRSSIVSDTLIAENKALERSDTVRLMITTLSHEINNPLAIAKGHLHILGKNINSHEETIDKIDKSLDRITKTVKEISKLSENNEVKTESYSSKNPIISLK